MFSPRSLALSGTLSFTFLLAAACGGSDDPTPGADAGDLGDGGGDNSPLTVTSTDPAAGGTDVALNVRIAATFSAEMDPATLTATSFTLVQGTTPVAGTVAYDGTTATFTPSAPLAANALYNVEITNAAADVNGHTLAAAHAWTFVTGTSSASGPARVSLGAAGDFVVLAKSAVSTVPASVITGDIGLSPAARTFATGFSLVADATNVFSTSTQVTGKIYAATDAVPTPTRLTTSVHDMEHAYTDAAGRPTPDFTELGTGNIGGKTLVPGLYKWTTTVTVPTDVILEGGANDVWIFQTSGDVTVAAAKQVTLAGGAQAKNVFWQVAGQVTVGAGGHFEGVVLAKTAITLDTGATMNGRALAQTQVVLRKATVTRPAP
jgi:hypothetical protein